MNSLTTKQIFKVLDQFVESAKLLIRAGYKIIQVHAAHGYFFSRLMNRVVNNRKDDFKFGSKVIFQYLAEGIKFSSSNVILDVRLNLLDGIENIEAEVSYKEYLYQLAIEAGFNVISLSNGFYDIDKNLIYPDKMQPHALYVEYVAKLAEKYSSVYWNSAGNIYDIGLLPSSIPANLTFSMGRQLIADPGTIEKFFCGNKFEINECNDCRLCHYYSRGERFITCPISPDLHLQ